MYIIFVEIFRIWKEMGHTSPFPGFLFGSKDRGFTSLPILNCLSQSHDDPASARRSRPWKAKFCAREKYLSQMSEANIWGNPNVPWKPRNPSIMTVYSAGMWICVVHLGLPYCFRTVTSCFRQRRTWRPLRVGTQRRTRSAWRKQHVRRADPRYGYRMVPPQLWPN